MTTAHIPGDPFKFESIVFADPTSGGQRGGYFSRLSCTDSAPLLIQTSATTSKSGITTTTRSTHIDIEIDPNSALHQWLADLENYILESITANSDKWFTSPMTADEISYLLVPVCKRQAKREFMRATIPVARYAAQSRGLSVFDENEVSQPQSSITADTRFIGVVEVVGVRFTSTAMRIELNLKQVMVLGKTAEPVCLVNKSKVAVETDSMSNAEPTADNRTVETTGEYEVPDQSSLTQTQLNVVVENGVSNREDNRKVTEDRVEPDVQTETEVGSGTYSASSNEAASISPSPTDVVTLEEVNVGIDAESEAQGIQLKEKHEVYQELYRELYERARMAKKQAIQLYLEAQELQVEHTLDAIDSSDDDDENEHILQ